jgi:N-acylneuraminate cytidylyltransferase
MKSGCFDKIIVSTDDSKIATIAMKYGASVPFMRPLDISDDYTGTNTVVKHAIQWLSDRHQKIEYVCCIYATAPFLTPKYIQNGFDRIIGGDYQFSFSVTTFPFPVQRSLRIKDSGGIEPIWPKYILERSQDLEETYHDAGQFYWGTSKAFLDDSNLFTPCSSAVVIPRYLVQDIDTPDDWQQAELMFQALLNNYNKVGI